MQYLVDKVWKTVLTPSGQLDILRGASLSIKSGETISILGASGSGKSTLLHVLGALDTASKGDVYYNGCNLAEMDANERAAFRNRKLGFVFQFHHLLPEFDTLENVAMPAIIGGMNKNEALRLAASALDKVGLQARSKHNVTTLSGGERQRAAIARATILNPEVLLADEPTGNLDQKNGELVVDLLLDLNRRHGMTMVMVTHNRELAARMDRSLELRFGELYE